MIEQKQVEDELKYNYINYVYTYNMIKYMKNKNIKNIPEFDINFMEGQITLLEFFLPDKIKYKLRKLILLYVKSEIKKINKISKYLK